MDGKGRRASAGDFCWWVHGRVCRQFFVRQVYTGVLWSFERNSIGQYNNILGIVTWATYISILQYHSESYMVDDNPHA
jgi:hypothetical protein